MHTSAQRLLRQNHGFTLVEIMVVVVILGILAAIVMPKLLGRPEEARITQVKTQIQGIEQAIGLFKLVITSYSIHYTKLYEKGFQHPSRRHVRPGGLV